MMGALLNLAQWTVYYHHLTKKIPRHGRDELMCDETRNGVRAPFAVFAILFSQYESE
jgi:hypothetical protein